MSTAFDRWLMFSGNPEEQSPAPTWCPYCGAIHHQEDDPDLCYRCLRAGVFRCSECREWCAAEMRGPDDICTDCTRPKRGRRVGAVPHPYHRVTQPQQIQPLPLDAEC